MMNHQDIFEILRVKFFRIWPFFVFFTSIVVMGTNFVDSQREVSSLQNRVRSAPDHLVVQSNTSENRNL